MYANYAIMDKNLNSFFFHQQCHKSQMQTWYDEHKENSQNPESHLYGCVMVRVDRVKAGRSFIFKIWWRRFLLKPMISIRFDNAIAWLFFYLKTDWEYTDKYVVVGDHLKGQGDE